MYALKCFHGRDYGARFEEKGVFFMQDTRLKRNLVKNKKIFVKVLKL